jgi:hypothetical protein
MAREEDSEGYQPISADFNFFLLKNPGPFNSKKKGFERLNNSSRDVTE